MRYTTRPVSDRTQFTSRHKPSPFDSSWSDTLTLLDRELRHLAARDVVMEVDVREQDIRLDGEIRATARPATPGVRIAFESRHGSLVYATDRFNHWQDNVRAIALGLEALRKVDRYGIADAHQQYTGWKALPAGRSTPASHMTADEAWGILGSFGLPPIAEQRTHATPDSLRALHKAARAFAHPDSPTGNRDLWDQVEEAARVLGVTS